MKRYILLFLTIWLYVMLAGMALQWVVLPLTPFHAGHGLMEGGDWTRFHHMGINLAATVKEQGWGAWVPRYETQAPASVAAALYLVTGIEAPWVLLPLHGLLWSMAGMALYSMAQYAGLKNKYALLTVAPLILFPSTAMIWGQIHKDIFSITGALLLAHYWLWWMQIVYAKKALGFFTFILRLLVLAGAVGLIVYVRPHLGQVLLLSSLAAFLTGTIVLTAQWKKKSRNLADIFRALIAGFVGLTVLFLVVAWERGQLKHTASISSTGVTSSTPGSSSTGGTSSTQECPGWRKSSSLPAALDKQLSAMACARDGFRKENPGGSSLDLHVGFNSVEDIWNYLPRALQISLFAPFPDSWFAQGVQSGGTMMRLLTIPEMLVLYISLVGVVLALGQTQLRMYVLVALAFSLPWVLIHTLTITNIGTLYRMRYPGMLIWIAMGLAGWAGWLQRLKGRAA